MAAIDRGCEALKLEPLILVIRLEGMGEGEREGERGGERERGREGGRVSE